MFAQRVHPRARLVLPTALAVIAAILLTGLAGHGHAKAAVPSNTAALGSAVPGQTDRHSETPRAAGATLDLESVDEATKNSAANSGPSYGTLEIAFVDPSVGDRKALLDSLRPSVETVMLEPGRDGVHQMAQFLRHRRGVQAIHVVSHGGPGTLGLGAGVLDANHPTDVRARELAVLGAALAEGGDILIYGCSFGAGRAGRAAVRALARATGADIAASDDPTGSAAFGGDWDLEVREGEVAARPVVAAVDGWSGVLQPRIDSTNQPRGVQVTSYTNTLTFTWELTPTERSPTDRRAGRDGLFVLEYRGSASGDNFIGGGVTQSSRANLFIDNVGIIDDLESDTRYEVRIRWQTKSGSTVSPWSTVTASTKPPLQISLETARSRAGQDYEQGYMTATWDTVAGADTRFMAIRRKGSNELIPLRDLLDFIWTDEERGRDFGMAGGLRADSEYEVQTVAVYGLYPRFEDADSASDTYVGFSFPYFGGDQFAFDVSEWVPIGPNAPPQFIEADWIGVWGQGRHGDTRQVTAVTETGTLHCKAEDPEGRSGICDPATAIDPDGGTLTYWFVEGLTGVADGKFEIDPSTGELKAKARGVADIEASLRPGETYAVVAVVADGQGGFDRMVSRFSLASPLSVIREPRAVPLFASASDSDSHGRQGFARVINHSQEAGEVRIDAFEDDGTHRGPLTLDIGANHAVHFNSDDLEEGNAEKGLDDGTGPGEGQWRLVLTSALDLEVLSYNRTDDGFLTSMHDVVPQTGAGHRVATFNPGRNFNQASRLRLVNFGADTAEITIVGIDDNDESPGTPVILSLPAGASRALTARELESGEGEGVSGALGMGAGKWQLLVTADQSIQVMSLLSSPEGHLTNLSTVPDNAETGADGATTTHTVALFPSVSDAMKRQGFVRVVNHSELAGEVRIDAWDDEGTHRGPLTLAIAAGQTRHFNSDDVEMGNTDKRLEGSTGPGEGDWRLELTSTLELQVLTYIRTDDGFLTSMHDLVPETEAGHRVAIFNPGRNTNQVSELRLVNSGAEATEVTIMGIDGNGDSPGTPVILSLPAETSRTLSVQELESGDGEGMSGALGTGAGKWQLVVTANRSVQVMSLLSSPTGHLTNLSTAPLGTVLAQAP